MSTLRYDWWPYVKGMIRRYPALARRYRDLGGGARSPERPPVRALPGTGLREYEAVRRAVETTGGYGNGEDRLKVVRLVLWDRSHTLEGAAMRVPCSWRTAAQWHGDFIKLTANYYGLMDEDCIPQP